MIKEQDRILRGEIKLKDKFREQKRKWKKEKKRNEKENSMIRKGSGG